MAAFLKSRSTSISSLVSGILLLGFTFFSHPSIFKWGGNEASAVTILFAIGLLVSFLFLISGHVFSIRPAFSNASLLLVYPISISLLFLSVDFEPKGLSSWAFVVFGFLLIVYLIMVLKWKQKESIEHFRYESLRKKTYTTHDVWQIYRRWIFNIVLICCSLGVFLFIPVIKLINKEHFSVWHESSDEAFFLSFILSSILVIVTIVFLIGPFLRRSKNNQAHYQNSLLWILMGCFFLVLRYFWAFV